MKAFSFILTVSLTVVFAGHVFARQVIPLYSGAVPGSRNVTDHEYSDKAGRIYQVSRPTLTLFKPEPSKATGTAVILCPGGGYRNLVVKWEGYDLAKIFQSKGITAFVLKYRLPSDVTMKNKSVGPLQDAQRAIYLVRKNAKKWGIDPDKIGIMGASAGGHLASTAGTHFEYPVIEHGNISLRPDFMILQYPVISMKEGITHAGSRKNLLGDHPPGEAVDLFSNELQVDSLTPPTFLVVAEDDKTVPVENSILFFKAMIEQANPVSFHVYQKGGHGFGKNPPRKVWMNDLFYWMQTNHWLPAKEDEAAW